MFESIPTHMDYSGQKKAELIFQVIVTVAGVIGFFVGYHTQQLAHSMYILFGGCVLAGFVTIPPWPMFRKDPIEWLKAYAEDVPPSEGAALAGKKKKASAKKQR